MDKELVFTGAFRNSNWFWKKYWYNGGNGRYSSFQTTLNLLNQLTKDPVIIETGCQRLPDDIGGGMSTSIFAEYIHRYNGSIYTVDIDMKNLSMAKACVDNINPNLEIEYCASDSVEWLSNYRGPSPDLLYLDSWDYPIFEIAKNYHPDFATAEKKMWELDPNIFIKQYYNEIKDCQNHCVNEFDAIKHKLKDSTILLLDDNLLPGGGKPRLLKEILPDMGWICLLDLQQSLWIRK